MTRDDVEHCLVKLVCVSVTQGDKMDLGSESSDDEDVEEFRYDMDIDEHRFLVPCFILPSPLLSLSLTTVIIIVMILIFVIAALSLFLVTLNLVSR